MSSWSFLGCCLPLFFLSRFATVATLPSASSLVSGLVARCKLGVLVSAGAATCLSTSLPSRGWKLGQAFGAVTGSLRLGFVLLIYLSELRCCRQQGVAAIA